MRKRLIYISGTVLLALLVGLVVWQTSFHFGDFAPSSPQQTLILWAVSTLIFILTVTLGFMLARNFVKLWVERHGNREGSRIRSKLVIGALVLTFTPVVFLVVFSLGVLNRNLDKWFTRPAENIKINLTSVGLAIEEEAVSRAFALADWASTLPEVERARAGESGLWGALTKQCQDRNILEVRVEPRDGGVVRLCSEWTRDHRIVQVRRGDLVLTTFVPIDLARTQTSITKSIAEYDQLHENKRKLRSLYHQLLLLITLFILFLATWVALFLARQISVPISALLGAAQEIRRGNLAYRVRVSAIDELASLVRAFNEMTQELEANRGELEKRRQFTEAILESIPTGVISISATGQIQSVNRALRGFFPAELVDRASRLADLFSRDDLSEIRYLMNRARRMGVAGSQLELQRDGKNVQASVTVAALEHRHSPGFVVVLEDTSDMLRAQKAAAWHEVARRIAHEIKNPLTPISLCADRIAVQLEHPNPETSRILTECSRIISSEVQTVRTLVDEFSQFARLPAAQPVMADLNEVVENALSVFAGRLEDITVVLDLSPALPQVRIDREQFKRLVVNLVDNAAEAMKESLVRKLYIGTSAPTPDTVELTIADTGSGITSADKERLFLPYFTTKSRGTGLGLAIVNHIVSEHDAQIRVEDNIPAGARFVIELSVPVVAETEALPTAGARS
jgi:PAS domain S-box-containing protein